MGEWSEFGQTLIGRWPQAKWDEATLVAYVREARVAGLEPEESTRALRGHEGPFPPSVGDLEVLVMGVRARLRERAVYCGKCEDGWVVEGRVARPCECRDAAIRVAAGRKPRQVETNVRRELPAPEGGHDDIPF